VVLENIAGYAFEAEVARLKKLVEANNGRVWRAYMKLLSSLHREKAYQPPSELPPLSQ
jgi:hypothetical protein